MKFLIQKIDKEIRHDFSFTLLESIRFQKWLAGDYNNVNAKYLNIITVKYVNCNEDDKVWLFKSFHRDYVPIGSVEFVSAWFKHFHNHKPLPINVPEELFEFAERTMWNGDENCYHKGYGKLFVKSNNHIKGFNLVIKEDYELPKGNYQFSEVIDIESEWRAFVFKGKLVGLQNYNGNFSTFPNIERVLWMVHGYKDAPVSYTLDVGVHDDRTFVIEVHDFFSCGLYGFSDYKILPFMHSRWHYEYLNKIKNGK